jgi:uncharacterized protein (TIGR02246 family)
MKLLIAVMFVLGFSLVQLSCSGPETFNEDQARKSIGEANAKYSEAMHQGNLAGVVGTYTDDATMFPPGGEMIKGKTAIEGLYRQFFQMGMKDIVLTTIDVGGCGDIIYEIGKTKVWIQPEGQEAIIDSTRYIVIWKRQADGSLKVHADIWNFNSPMKGR